MVWLAFAVKSLESLQNAHSKMKGTGNIWRIVYKDVRDLLDWKPDLVVMSNEALYDCFVEHYEFSRVFPPDHGWEQVFSDLSLLFLRNKFFRTP